MPRLSRHSTFPSPRLTFLCPCVDRAITSSPHRFPSPQPVAFACVLLPGSPLGMYSPHQQHSFVSYIDRGSADTFDGQHTNKPAPLVSLLETYLCSVHFFTLRLSFSFFFLVVAIPTIVFLQPCNTFDYYPPFLSLSIVLVLICFNSVTLCLSPNLYNCMMQMVFRPIGLASQLSMRRIFEQRQSDDRWGDWKRAIITPTGRSDGIVLTDNCKHNPQDKLADAVSSWPFSKNMWKCIFT